MAKKESEEKKMKKVFKIIGIIVVIILVLIGGNFGFVKVRELMKDNERKNAKTLMEYVKTHSYDYVDSSSEEMSFLKDNLNCDGIEKLESGNIKGILYDYGDTMYILLNDSSYISVLFGNEKLYSNNQYCKKTDNDIKVKDIKKYDEGYYVISEDNKMYNAIYIRDNTNNIVFEGNKDNNTLYIDILLNDNVQNIIKLNNGKNEAIVLKKDGSLYKQKYKYNNETFILDKEEIFISNTEYGNILNATLNYNSDKNDYEINTLTTDKGYYYYGEIKTEECTKYQDISCEKVIIESEIYKKFSKDIKYIDNTYTILSDNSIISTEYLTYPLDKDLRN